MTLKTQIIDDGDGYVAYIARCDEHGMAGSYTEQPLEDRYVQGPMRRVSRDIHLLASAHPTPPESWYGYHKQCRWFDGQPCWLNGGGWTSRRASPDNTCCGALRRIGLALRVLPLAGRGNPDVLLSVPGGPAPSLLPQPCQPPAAQVPALLSGGVRLMFIVTFERQIPDSEGWQHVTVYAGTGLFSTEAHAMAAITHVFGCEPLPMRDRWPKENPPIVPGRFHNGSHLEATVSEIEVDRIPDIHPDEPGRGCGTQNCY